MNIPNESIRRPWFLSALVAVLAAGCLTGCHSIGYKKADEAALNSQLAAGSVQAESQELQATITALNDLVNQPAVDARPQFLKFEQALNRLTASVRSAESEVNKVWKKWDAYFAVWEKEIPTIKDPTTRSLSETRKADVSNKFDAAKGRYAETGNNVQPLIAYLQDIRKALSTDLTRDGLAALKSSVYTANERAQQLQATLAQAATELDTLSARSASFRMQDSK